MKRIDYKGVFSKFIKQGACEFELSDSRWKDCDFCGQPFQEIGLSIETEAPSDDYCLVHVCICRDCLESIVGQINNIQSLDNAGDENGF